MFGPGRWVGNGYTIIIIIIIITYTLVDPELQGVGPNFWRIYT